MFLLAIIVCHLGDFFVAIKLLQLIVQILLLTHNVCVCVDRWNGATESGASDTVLWNANRIQMIQNIKPS